MNPLLNFGTALVERGLVPDPLLRLAIRQFIRASVPTLSAGGDAVKANQRFRALLADLRAGPIAIHTADANAQHYEVPTSFFTQVLGPRMKYSSCLYPNGQERLEEAEEAMLSLSCQRADLQDGLSILELGCGWGSLCLWLCEKYPKSQITAVSNSRTQREYIMAQAATRGFTNLEVITCDMNDFQTEKRFDRVMSVEMFEHMRNFEQLMARVASWLKPGGKLFVHIFAHREYAYAVDAKRNWLAQHFFTGGVMPSEDLLLHFQRDMALEEYWRVNGSHYARTLETWLRTFDARYATIQPILSSTYGPANVTKWRARWRLFFIACAEIMNANRGNDYLIAHYRFSKR
jgi:cyclopropane-fatty-acyl-phospholipid synthase